MHPRSIALLSTLLLTGASLGVAGCGSGRSDVEIGTPGTGTGGSGEPSGTATAPPNTDGGLADCAEILRAYANLATTAVRGKDAAAQAEKTLDGLKSKLPSDLQDDLTVVSDAFGTIADRGVVEGASALTSSAFVEANKNIVGYLRDDCLPG